jgi:hypothetical protein
MFELKYAKAKACSGKQFWGKTRSYYNNPKWTSTTYWPLPILLTKTLNPGNAKKKIQQFQLLSCNQVGNTCPWGGSSLYS